MTREEQIRDAAFIASMTEETIVRNEVIKGGVHVGYKDIKLRDSDRPIARLFFRKGVEWADENPKSPWISVEEMLPEVNQQVYAAMPHMCSVEYATIEYLGDNRWSQDDGEYTYKFSGGVAYWMPIPELPKEE